MKGEISKLNEILKGMKLKNWEMRLRSDGSKSVYVRYR